MRQLRDRAASRGQRSQMLVRGGYAQVYALQPVGVGGRPGNSGGRERRERAELGAALSHQAAVLSADTRQRGCLAKGEEARDQGAGEVGGESRDGPAIALLRASGGEVHVGSAGGPEGDARPNRTGARARSNALDIDSLR